MNKIPYRNSRRAASGLSLIELMIAIVLGLLVVGAAIGIFISNKQAFRSADSLGVVQENVRTAFELVARDVREAGGNPCVNTAPIANVVNTSAASWWSNFNAWGTTVQGYDGATAFPGGAFGTGAAARLAGSDAIQLISGGNEVATISGHDPAAGSFTLNRADHGIVAGDLVMACNSRQASVFQVGGVSGTTITYSTGGTPGNCSANLGLVGVGEPCGTRAAFEYAAPNSVMVKLHASRWFIANNPNGRPSLYQTLLTGSGVTTQEVAEGVNTLGITYLLNGAANYVGAGAVGGNWANVIAARIDMRLEGTPNTGTGGTPVERELVHVVSLRNRNL